MEAPSPLDSFLDLRNKLHQRSLRPDLNTVVGGGTLDVPFMVELDPTSYCDLACPECVSKDLLNSSQFSRERLMKLASELVDTGVKAVIFVGGGEPLIHPAMAQAIEICGRGGLKIGIITNGTQLGKYTELLARYAEWVRVSVDAARPQTFARFRPHRSGRNLFHPILENMRALKSAGLRTLGFSFLLMSREERGEVIESNHNEIFEAGLLAKSIGCNYLEVKAVFDPVTHVVCPQPPLLLREVEGQLERVRSLEDDSFRVVPSQSLIELMSGDFLANLYDYGKCHVSELRTLISPHGVYVCPLYRGKVEYSFGDPTRQSLREIWSGRGRAEIMASLRPCVDCLPKCSRHLSNIEIDRIAGGLASPPMVDDFDFFI